MNVRGGCFSRLHRIGLAAAVVGAIIAGRANGQAEIQNEVTPDRIEEVRSEHWSFQPIGDPDPPAVEDEAWGRSPIDRFVLARLEANGLSASPEADRRTLIRRAYFDLVGLPPAYEEVEAFVNDKSPDAFEKVVDHLLASPEYGERWGRHWLDVARYADTKGYVAGGEDRRYAFSYTYRDYVIRSFNEDKPYDRFIVEQLAADRLDLGEDKRPLAAMGFLTVGRRFINNIHEITDDRIDVVTRGLMGMTVACARCHDHKYDPIQIDDYYSLYGVFRSAEEPDTLPIISEPEMTPEYEAYLAEEEKRKQAVEDYIDEAHAAITEELRSRAGDYLVYIARTHPNHKIEGENIAFTGERGAMRRRASHDWQRYLDRTAEEPGGVFSLWHRLIALEREGFAEAAKGVIEGADPAGEGADESDDPKVNTLLLDALKESPPESMADVARVYGEVLEGVHGQWKELVEESEGESAPGALPDPAAEELRQAIHAPGTPTTPGRNGITRLFDQGQGNKLREVRNHVAQWRIESPAAPPRAMVMTAREQPHNPRIFQRGNPGSPGETVPRRFLHVLSGVDGGEPYEGGGRLELARAIASPENPLTARVLVNRVWKHHFGQGLVTTPSDFGLRSDPPSHPDLLDHLATRFIDGGWSIKQLHRDIMLSSTYRQASDRHPKGEEIDLENRLLWRMNRRRLEFEPMRDALLEVADRLDTTRGGRGVNLFQQPYPNRRSVYGVIDRQDLPNVLRAFDFASPDASSPGRPNTTVPQQALYMMNNPFVIEQAGHVLNRPPVQTAADTPEKVRAVYRTIFARDPGPEEVELAVAFIEAESAAEVSPEELSPWQKYVQILLLSNEFVFVD